MNKLLSLLALGLALSAGGAYAASHAAAPMADGKTAQQSKMSTCNKEAGDKKGDERKAFMKTCLSAKSPAASECDTKAAEKKLAGAAKTSFTKKCMADAGAAKK